MKKLIKISIILVAAAVITLPTKAQESKFTVSAGLGWASTDDYAALFELLINSSGKFNYSESDKAGLNPNISIGYRVDSWLSAGIGLSYGWKEKRKYDYNNLLLVSSKLTYISLIAQIHTRYYRNDKMTIYGNYGLGRTFVTDRQIKRDDYGETSVSYNRQNHFNLNCYPFCVGYGNKIGGFLELGIGSKGLVNVGCYMDF